MVEKQLQIKITPSEQQLRIVQELLDRGYMRDAAAVVSASLNRALPELVSECVAHEKFLGNEDADLIELATLARDFLVGLTQKRKPTALDVQRLADRLGVSSESLAALVSECCCEKEGESTRDRKART